MFEDLPRPLASKTGFQGCFASFEINGELLDPIKNDLVLSTIVEEGCKGTSEKISHTGTWYRLGT